VKRLAPLVVLLAACGTKHVATTSDASVPALVGPIVRQRVIVDLPAHVDQCVLGHEGVLLDLGVPAARPLYGIKETAALEPTEHDGATWDRVSSHTLTFRFAGSSQDAPVSGGGETFVDVRLRALGARRLGATLNGKTVGTVPLSKNDIVTKSFHVPASLVTAGTNELVLHFGGAGRAPDAVAEVDWVRVGTQPDTAYVAPTFNNAVATETLAGVPRRAIALRAPAFVRCTAAIPKGATFDVSLGLLGKGAGDAEVRLLRDRMPPLVLGTAHVDDASGWTTLSLTVPDDARGVGAVEVRVDRGTPTARVLVADAKLHVAEAARVPRARPARGVVLVVLGQTPGTATTLPVLALLGQRSHVFDANRATSTWAAAAVASMLTGVLPSEHGAEGDGSRLADGVMTVADAVRQAGIATAMFTANPTTAAAFGLSRGFETFESFFPGSEGGAMRVLEQAASWIGTHKAERFFLVVHARGGHPPWDVPPDQIKGLPPDGYTGPIEPGVHAAEILSHARHVPPLVRFNDVDRKRAWGMHDWAVSAHDAAVGRLLAALDEAGHRDDVAVIVTGDVGIDTSAHVPFGDAEPLEESALTTPLVVPSVGETTGLVVHAPTSSIDIATTVLAELGLAPPLSFEGEDLVGAETEDGTRALVASTGERTLVSWMGLLLRSSVTQSELCVPAIDAACASDATPLAPLASEALRKLLHDASRKPAVHVAPTLDGKTAAALTLWGR
jgi:hypothetical protein